MNQESAAAYRSECEDLLETAKEALADLEDVGEEKSIATVLNPLNNLWIRIDRGSNQAGLFSAVHPDPAMRETADYCEQEFRKLVTSINLSRPLYNSVTAMDVSAEDAATQRYVKHLLRDFRRAGVDKDDAVRKQIRAINDELVKIGQEFGKNIREDVRSIQLDSAEDLKGLPADYVAAHEPGTDGKIKVTTDYPDYIPFMTYAESDSARLALYIQFRKRGHPKNFDNLSRLLQKRHELAKLLGYPSWAEYATEVQMIKEAGKVQKFIDRIHAVAIGRAESDYEELLIRLKQDDPDAVDVGDWQKSWIEEKLQKEKYQVDSQKVRSYFSYAKTRDGLFSITSAMFGIRYRRITEPTWHPDVEGFEILDSGDAQTPIGRFYLDMHPRADKYKHAAAFPIVTGVDGYQIPEAALVCNFPATGPMEHDQVETFFHEFGHLLHHVLGGKHRWIGVSGFNTELDFVEAPSQMLEEWAWDAQTLKSFAKNEAGEVMPDDLIAAMRKARDFGKGLWVTQQMFYAALSLSYYNQDPAGFDTTEVMKAMQEEYSPFAYVDDTYFHLSFGHLDGYSANYYSYMWALVIAKDLFSVFQDKGMLNPEAAARYREMILAPGGSKDAAAMVYDFLGRAYTFDAFAKWLNGG